MYKKMIFTNSCPPFQLARHTFAASAPETIGISDKLCIFFILSGGVSCNLNGSSQTVQPNTALLFHTMNLQRIRSIPGCNTESFMLSISPEDLSLLSTEQTNLLDCFYYRPFDAAQLLPLTPADMEQITALLSRLMSLNGEAPSSYGNDLFKKTILTELFLLLNMHYRSCHHLQDTVTPDRRARIYAILNHIHRNYSRDISAENLSDDYNINKFALGNAFRQITGCTISQYITNCRMEKAKELLLAGARVEIVCECVGYINLSHFSRAFKNYTGKSPKQFQMAFRKECDRL